jgi:hypothetical protein
VFPNQVIRADDLARAMVDLAISDRGESGSLVLENRDIRAMIKSHNLPMGTRIRPFENRSPICSVRKRFRADDRHPGEHGFVRRISTPPMIIDGRVPDYRLMESD